MKRTIFFSILAASFLAVSTLNLLAQSVWTGGAGTTNWNTPGNWTGGVPAAGKTVTIYTCSTCPRISTSSAQAAFVQVYAGGKLTIANGGILTIENPGGPGMKTHATSQVNVNQGGALAILSFWGEGLAIGGTFQNGGTININGGHTGIAVSAGASFTNTVNGFTNVTGSSLNYALTSSGTVQNNGILDLDDANNDGISQQTGTITNGVNGTLNITQTGVNAIFAKGTFNNNGTLNIGNGLNGIYLLFGTFNNNASGKISISGATFLNEGIYIDPGTFKNSGELTILHALSKGIEISGGSTFNNFNKITLDVPAWVGIFNVGGSNFQNRPCALIQTNAPIVSYATFTNSGIIRETSSGNSQIGQNNGAVINHLGGSFSVSGGNEVITESGAIVWTGCSNTNWTNADNWFPAALPSVQFSRAIVQNVAQASGNAPTVSSTVVSPLLYLHNGSNLTVAGGGSLSISDGMLGAGYLEVRQGANMTVQASGTFSSSSTSILGGSIQNSGSFNIPAPFHSVGTFGMNGGTFNNLSGGTFTGTTGQLGAGVNASLSGGATFINSGTVTIGGFGGFFLNQSTLNNFASGGIAMPSGGRISNLNSSSVINNGSIAINNQSPDGIRCESSTFDNGGSIVLSFTNILQYGGTFTNTGSISIASPASDGIVNGGTFSSSGNLSVQQSGTHHGILNLNGATFSTGAGSISLFDHVSNGVINFGTFSNGGTLDVNTTNFARGIESQGNFVNQTTGVISIRNTVNEGLVNFNTFSNHGVILVENIPTQDGIATTGTFENGVFGKITVNNVGEAGFWVFGGTCNNAGQISTDQTGWNGVSNGGNFTNFPTGSISVKNADGGLTNFATFTNQAGGNLEIDHVSTHALFNFNTVINMGRIFVANSTFEGIANDGSLFENTASGSITVEQNQPSIWTGITNGNGAPFINSGVINLGGDNLQSIRNYVASSFTNRPCAIIFANGFIDNQGIFNNEGLLRSSFVGTNSNTGTFSNNGVIEDFYDSFNGVPFTNAAVRVRPISGMAGGFIQNALEIGFNSPFAIGTTWYLDANQTNPAGTYNPGVNTFEPTVGVGTHMLYLTAEDLVNNCRKTVSIQVNIVSALIGYKFEEANITLYNYPNPFSQITAVNVSLPFDTEGKLAIFDAQGRLVEVLYEGEIRKDELYQFEFNGADKRVGLYAANLILKDGRTYPIRLVKADNE